jgi:hypothetical protein
MMALRVVEHKAQACPRRRMNAITENCAHLSDGAPAAREEYKLCSYAPSTSKHYNAYLVKLKDKVFFPLENKNTEYC